MRLNAKFNEKVRQTWLWFMSSEFDGLYQDIDTYVAHIAEAAKADRRRWRDRPVPDGGQSVVDNSDMTARRNDVVNHLNRKIDWLKGIFGDYAAASYAEPERDTTPAAPLPEYAVSGVENVSTDIVDGPVEYYNLQGQPVSTPTAGSIVIERRGTRAVKTVIR